MPMTLHEHITLDAYEQRLMRSRWTRSYSIGRTLCAGLACSIMTVACAVAQIGGVL